MRVDEKASFDSGEELFWALDRANYFKLLSVSYFSSSQSTSRLVYWINKLHSPAASFHEHLVLHSLKFSTPVPYVHQLFIKKKHLLMALGSTCAARINIWCHFLLKIHKTYQQCNNAPNDWLDTEISIFCSGNEKKKKKDLDNFLRIFQQWVVSLY